MRIVYVESCVHYNLLTMEERKNLFEVAFLCELLIQELIVRLWSKVSTATPPQTYVLVTLQCSALLCSAAHRANYGHNSFSYIA